MAKNKILEQFEKMQEQQAEQLELETPSEDEADDGYEVDHSVELTDEDVEAAVDQASEDDRLAIQQSRRAGRDTSQRQRAGRENTERAEARARNPKRERIDEWKPANSLDAPPKRRGMEQRWIRYILGDKNDPRNFTRKAREGWTPRRLDTVSQDYSPPTMSHSSLGEVIAVGDLILCERPAHIGRQRADYFRKKHERQMAAATRKHVNKVQQGDRPITVTERRDRPTVGIGTRRPQAQDD